MTSAPRPGRQADGSSDRRSIVLVEDGCYSTLGRASHPSEDEVQQVEDALRGHGLGGWLAVMSRSEYHDVMPTVVEVRRIGEPAVSFTEAVGRFEQLVLQRRQA